MGVIEVLAGGAATGKTTWLLELYRAELRQAMEHGRPGTTLWLSPTHHSVREVQQRLVDASVPAVFQPNVLRFDEFAMRILERRPKPVARLTPVMRRALLRRIVDQLLTERKIVHFAAIARTSGFLDQLSAFISEMKRAEIWPETYLEVCRQAGAVTARDRELADLYAKYQEILIGKNLYDAEGRFWYARQEIAGGAWAPFQELSLVVVDGFADFLHTQYEILQALAGKAGRMIVSLPLEEGDGRADLFAKPLEVLERLRQCCEVRLLTPPLPSPSERLPESLRQVAKHLFRNPRDLLPAVSPEGVEIVPVAGATGERQMLAARVKSLLLNGVSPNDVVVVLRQLSDADLLVEQFEASGIPVTCEAGLPLSRTSAIRGLMTALAVETEDWQFERLMALLDSNSFRPQWEGVRVRHGARDVSHELRRLKLPFSREAILETLESEAAENPSGDLETGTTGEPAGESPPQGNARAQSAFTLLQHLDAAFVPLRTAHTLPEWTRVLRTFAGELGLLPAGKAVETDEDNWDARVWELFNRLLVDLSRAERCLRDADDLLNLSEFVRELTDLVRTVAVPGGSPRDGSVRILDAEHVRNLDVPFLFVAGLSEDSFPARHAEGCVLYEVERRALRQQGLDLRNRDHHQQDEMLLFHQVVTRARRKLVLSYPAVDAKGHPLCPSPYLVALNGLLPDLKPVPDERLDPVPPSDRVLTESDLRVFAMDEALRKRPELLSALWSRPTSGRAITNALAAVDMAAARFHQRGFTEFEGKLQTPGNLRAIAERFGPGHEYSVSLFERYVECPFRFLMSEVFRIEELASPDVRIDFAARGSVVHDVLARLHEECRENGQTPSGAELAERFIERLKSSIHRLPRRSSVQKALAFIEERSLNDLGRAYGEQWDDYVRLSAGKCDASLRPEHFELSFGQPGTREAAPARDPLVLGTDDEAIRIGGFIDRVDVGVRDGRPAFVVIDYKTGRAPQVAGGKLLENVQKGRTLQLVMYALAVERLGLAGESALPVTLGYWGLAGKGFEPAGTKFRSWKPMTADTWRELCESLEAVVPRLAASLRRGEFPIFNENKDCTGRCPYKTACRVSQVRALSPQLEKHWEP